jgi:hypothetical protein
MRAMSHLHRWRIAISINGDDFAPEALQLNYNFLAQLTRAEQHDARSGW